MNSFELDQPLDLRLKALNLSRGFSHEPHRASPSYPLQQYGAPHHPQHHQNLLVMNNMMLNSCSALPACNNNKLMLATTTAITPDLYYTPPLPQPPTLEPQQQQQQQQQQSQHQIVLTPTIVNVHQHHQDNRPNNHPASPVSQCSTPLSSTNGNICNPAPIINQKKQRSLNHSLASPISSSFKSSSPPSSQRQPPQTSHQRNTQNDLSPSTPSAAASPMIRQHSLISPYNCNPCGIAFSQPGTLKAHQELYCTKTNRNQLRSQSAGFALSHPADCDF